MTEASFTVKVTVEPDTPAAPTPDLTLAGCAVVKMAEERRYTLGVAYPANKADVAVAADGRRDFMTADEVEKTAWEWMAKSRRVGLGHQDGTEGHGTVVESYIWRGDPWIIPAANGSTQVVKAGDWLLGVRWDEDAWEAVKAGRIGGYSPQGVARRRTPTAAQIAGLRA